LVPLLRRLACALALFAAVTSVSARAAATVCPAGAGGSAALLAIDGQVRLDWIDARLTRGARRARLWTWGWGTALVVATGANLVPVAYVAKGDRIDWYTGAVTTVIGIVPLVIAPLDVVGDAKTLHARQQAARAAGADSDDDVCRRLAEAESLMVSDAKNQEDGQRWWLHAGNVVLNTGVGLFLGFGYHHWGAGAFNAIFGMAVGEAIILTQPTDTVGDLKRYRAADLEGGDGGRLETAHALAIGYGGRF
jgi:hypothetical protein